jgi:hypothetical protein
MISGSPSTQHSAFLAQSGITDHRFGEGRPPRGTLGSDEIPPGSLALSRRSRPASCPIRCCSGLPWIVFPRAWRLVSPAALTVLATPAHRT